MICDDPSRCGTIKRRSGCWQPEGDVRRSSSENSSEDLPLAMLALHLRAIITQRRFPREMTEARDSGIQTILKTPLGFRIGKIEIQFESSKFSP
jgi:hypothetical protein